MDDLDVLKHDIENQIDEMLTSLNDNGIPLNDCYDIDEVGVLIKKLDDSLLKQLLPLIFEIKQLF